ncbi:MAG: aldo/keto reductase [Isosphaeraceae bacterium]
MEHRILGRTGLKASVLGFGGAPVSFLGTEAAEIERLLNELLDHGINVIDTAAMYPGSEELIGKAVGHRRKEYILVTKCGSGWNKVGDRDWTAEGITKFVDRSLQRLQTDCIDVMLLHSCDLATLQKGEALDALVAARDAGKIKFAGYSGDNEAAAEAVTMPDVAVLETSISIADQANIDMVLPGAVKHDVGVIVKRPIANAAWKPLSEMGSFYAGYAKVYHDRLQAMQLDPAELGFEGPNAWAEMALRFTLAQPGVHTAIVGTTNRERIDANRRTAGHGLLQGAVIERIREAFRKAEAGSGKKWTAQT